MAHLPHSAPLLYIFLCKTTNGAPQAGAPLLISIPLHLDRYPPRQIPLAAEHPPHPPPLHRHRQQPRCATSNNYIFELMNIYLCVYSGIEFLTHKKFWIC